MSSAPSQQQPPLQSEQPSVPAANVNVKIIINNHVHRKVLTLDAMHVDLFERSIRKCVPHHMGDILIERYSDSAGRYTIVDPAIPSSYKQLYRAAKAKGKLRVRIIQVPQPGQASDVGTALTSATSILSLAPIDQANDSNKNTTGTGTNTTTSNTNIQKPEIHPITKAKPHSQTHTPIRKRSKATVRLPPPTRAQLEVISSHNVTASSENDQSLLNSNQHTPNQQNHVSGHENTLKWFGNYKRGYPIFSVTEQLQGPGQVNSTTFDTTSSNINVNSDVTTAPIVGSTHECAPTTTEFPVSNIKLASTLSTACPAVIYPPKGPDFQICCNSCSNAIDSDHWHCNKCDMGDYDLCPSCFAEGKGCDDDGHWLIRRAVVDGVLVSGSTEVARVSKLASSKSEKNMNDKMSSLSFNEHETKLMEQSPIVIKRKDNPENQETKTEDRETSNGNNDKLSIGHVIEPSPKENLRSSYNSPWNVEAHEDKAPAISRRTCNGCVHEFADNYFVHCTHCPDFDLCFNCFTPTHGHHPAHGFVLVAKGPHVPQTVLAWLKGHHNRHHALCDGCDKAILGTRYKCLDCPDWDYCSSCSSTISITHKGHRFVRLYEPMSTLVSQRPPAAQHYGVYCDGPLCVAKGHKNHISGVRYKCGFCHDLDFCDACEASPSNTHDKTHPLIMMKTPTSHLVVSSRLYDGNCRLMDCMGDIVDEAGLDKNNLPSLSMATKPAVADVEPVKETPSTTTMPAAAILGGVRPAPLSVETLSPPMPSPIPPTEVKTAFPSYTEAPSRSQWPSMALVEQTPDKMICVPTDYVFTMCWELKNNGETVWPAGSYIELNGGDQLFTPKMRREMAQETSSRSVFRVTASDLYLEPVAPGESAKYEVSLCSPMEPGTYSSGWRLTMSGGHRVGELMISEIRVEGPIPVLAMSNKAGTEVKAEKTSVDHTMVFPTLETESLVATLTGHTDDISPATTSATVTTDSEIGSLGDFEPNEEWVSSDAEFMTDEEYDILDGLEDECRSY
ncbi:hypothetical protein Cpir12675_003802 [Ceratocystis pirilliformis]|uniref:ZZ-type domain-containing protein n=1 Tax=Ceratocystis pirilliformis TaxID=259994 RepID=A0ABR3Z0F7_9PEZI